MADQETRDLWWAELRDEVKSHAKALQCSVVLGYSESCVIDQDVCILSATGSAALLKPLKARPKPLPGCSVCHKPYSFNTAPFSQMRLSPCGLCKQKWVPELLLSTTEPPLDLPVTGSGMLVESRVCKSRGKVEGKENDAGVISETLVFLEIEMHRQLLLKLKVMGMNAAFALRSQVTFTNDLIMGVISATAIHTPVLPPPPVLSIVRSIGIHDQEDVEFLTLQVSLVFSC